MHESEQAVDIALRHLDAALDALYNAADTDPTGTLRHALTALTEAMDLLEEAADRIFTDPDDLTYA